MTPWRRATDRAFTVIVCSCCYERLTHAQVGTSGLERAYLLEDVFESRAVQTASHELLQKLRFLGTKFRMRQVQDEHDPAAVGLLEHLVLVRVVDFEAPVLADAADARAVAQELRDPWTPPRVVDRQLPGPIVKGKTVQLRPSVSPLLSSRLSTWYWFGSIPANSSRNMATFCSRSSQISSVGQTAWLVRWEQNRAGISLAQRSPRGTSSWLTGLCTRPPGII